MTVMLDYIVQGHRFDIIEQFGCRPSIYNSLASLFLIWIPPLLFSIGAGVFSGKQFFHYSRRLLTPWSSFHSYRSTPLLHPSNHFHQASSIQKLCSDGIALLPTHVYVACPNFLGRLGDHGQHVVHDEERLASVDGVGRRPRWILSHWSISPAPHPRYDVVLHIHALVDHPHIIRPLLFILLVWSRGHERISSLLPMGQSGCLPAT